MAQLINLINGGSVSSDVWQTYHFVIRYFLLVFKSKIIQNIAFIFMIAILLSIAFYCQFIKIWAIKMSHHTSVGIDVFIL